MIVDAFLKWPEVIEMNSSITTKTVEALRHVFALHGLPEQLVICEKGSYTHIQCCNFKDV